MRIADDLAAQPAVAITESRRLVALVAESPLEGAIDEESRVLASRYGSEENVAAVMAFLSRKR